MQVTNEVLAKIEAALRDGTATEQRPKLAFREYPVKIDKPRKAKPLVQPSVKLTITVPCVVVSESNERCHWAARYRRFKKQGAALMATLAMHGINLARFSAHTEPHILQVTLTRIGGRRMDEHDNLKSALKGVVDAVAAALGFEKDNDSRLTWLYEQESGPLSGVRIEVSPA